MKKQFPFFAFVSAGLVSAYMIVQLAVPVDPKKGMEEVHVESGMTFSQAARLLEADGFIRDSRLFTLLGRLTGADRRLRPGYYDLDGTMSPWAIFKMLRNALLVQKEITIVEGDSLMEIRQKMILRGLMNASDFDRLAYGKAFLKSLGIDAPSIEGYLFPDTYRFPKGTSPEQVFTAMYKRLEEEFNPDLSARAASLGLNLNSVLTLASIIEKEAVVDPERPLISAVFYNRMKRGIPLQADPTAVYGIKPIGEGVTKWDLLRKTKYNTYLIRGLPPGPIASPGLKSIKAALYPAKVDYLYFVSNHDGTHTFTSNYSDHLKAVENLKAKIESEAQQDASSGTDEKKKN